jgi:thioredoxin 1
MTTTIEQVSDDDFVQKVLASDRPVLVDFWADWCGPCHVVAPVVQEIADERPDTLRVAKLNVDDNPYTAQQHGVLSIPTLILFRGGKEHSRVVGARSKESITHALLRDVAA